MNNQSPLRFCFSSSAYSLQRISIMSRIALFYFKGNVPFHLLMIFGKHTFVSKKSKQCADFHLFCSLLFVLFIKKGRLTFINPPFLFVLSRSIPPNVHLSLFFSSPSAPLLTIIPSSCRRLQISEWQIILTFFLFLVVANICMVSNCLLVDARRSIL